MSKWRKHVMAGGYVKPPEDGQQIVQAVGSRGSNQMEASAAAPPQHGPGSLTTTGCLH